MVKTLQLAKKKDREGKALFARKVEPQIMSREDPAVLALFHRMGGLQTYGDEQFISVQSMRQRPELLGTDKDTMRALLLQYHTAGDPMMELDTFISILSQLEQVGGFTTTPSDSQLMVEDFQDEVSSTPETFFPTHPSQKGVAQDVPPMLRPSTVLKPPSPAPPAARNAVPRRHHVSLYEQHLESHRRPNPVKVGDMALVALCGLNELQRSRDRFASQRMAGETNLARVRNSVQRGAPLTREMVMASSPAVLSMSKRIRRKEDHAQREGEVAVVYRGQVECSRTSFFTEQHLFLFKDGKEVLESRNARFNSQYLKVEPHAHWKRRHPHKLLCCALLVQAVSRARASATRAMKLRNIRTIQRVGRSWLRGRLMMSTLFRSKPVVDSANRQLLSFRVHDEVVLMRKATASDLITGSVQ